MKKLILKSKITLVILSFLTFASCSKDDDSPTVKAPTVSYTTTSLDAAFFQSGNSSAPEIQWNGDQGNFSLTSSIIGLSINTTTGVLNWTKDLPLGTHEVEVVATNNAGQTSKILTLNNPLQGIFTGTYDSSEFLELEFNANGTIVLRTNDETSPDTATGTWEREGDTITVNYTYDSGSSNYSLLGTLDIGTTAIYSGDWYVGHGAISGNKNGAFEAILN